MPGVSIIKNVRIVSVMPHKSNIVEMGSTENFGKTYIYC
jgi:hypothetical protein